MASLARIEAAARRLGFRLVVADGSVRLRSATRRAPAALAAAVDHFEGDLLAALHEREVAIAERIAIAVEDGGLPEPWACFLARIEAEPAPPGWAQDRDWAAACAVLWARVDQHARELDAHGWTPQAIWRGLPDGDDPDLLLLCDDAARIEAVERQAIRLINAAGRAFEIDRRF